MHKNANFSGLHSHQIDAMAKRTDVSNKPSWECCRNSTCDVTHFPKQGAGSCQCMTFNWIAYNEGPSSFAISY